MWDLLYRIITILSAQQIAYMLVGSFAASFHGLSRATHDLDIVIQLDIDGLDRLLDALGEDYYFSRDAAESALERGDMFNLIDQITLDKIDFWIGGNDEFSKSQFQRAMFIDTGGYCVCVQSPEDVILSKLLWHKMSNSERQINDIKAILTASSKTLDWEYLNRWAESLDVMKMLQKQKEDI